MGNLTDTRSREQGMILGSSSRLDLLGDYDKQDNHDNDKFFMRLSIESARSRMISWISRSRVASGGKSARRGARIRGQ